MKPSGGAGTEFPLLRAPQRLNLSRLRRPNRRGSALNGAGKSTIFAAVEWGLYGARGRGTLPRQTRRRSREQELLGQGGLRSRRTLLRGAPHRRRGSATTRAAQRRVSLHGTRRDKPASVDADGTHTRDVSAAPYARQREVHRRWISTTRQSGALRSSYCSASSACDGRRTPPPPSLKEQNHLDQNARRRKAQARGPLRSEAEQIEADAQKAPPIVQAAEA